MSTSAHIVHQSQYHNKPLSLIGSVAQKLEELQQHKLPLLESFCITSQVSRVFLNQPELKAYIDSKISEANLLQYSQLTKLASDIQKAILKAPLQTEIASEISKAHAQVGGSSVVQLSISPTDSMFPEPLILSNTDAPLRAKGDAHLLEVLKQVYARLFSAEVLAYRLRKEHYQHFYHVAIVVQVLVPVEASGVVTTLDRVHNNKNLITIEATSGFADALLSGHDNADFYQVDKGNWKITQHIVKKQNYIKNIQNFHRLKKVRPWNTVKPKLTQEEIISLAKLATKVQKVTYYHQNITWLKSKSDFYITEVDSFDSSPELYPLTEYIDSLEMLVQGIPASSGVATGEIKHIHSQKQLQTITHKDIAVITDYDPKFRGDLKRAAGLIFKYGGQTSHSSVYAREQSIPSITGLGDSLPKLEDGTLVSINGTTGKLFKGKLQNPTHGVVGTEQEQTKTATKIFVDIDDCTAVSDLTSENIDGVGWVNARGVLNKIEKTPVQVLTNSTTIFTQTLYKDMQSLCEHLGSRPIHYSLLDIDSLTRPSGHEEESFWGGVEWLLSHKEWLNLELEVFFSLSSQFPNLKLQLPFSRYYQEVIEIERLISAHHAKRSVGLELWLEIKNTAAIRELSQLERLKLSGVLIHLDELITRDQGYPGFDEETESHIRFQQTSVASLIKETLRTTRKNDLKAYVISKKSNLVSAKTTDLVEYGFDGVVCVPSDVQICKNSTVSAEHKLANS